MRRTFILISHGLHTNCTPVTSKPFSINNILGLSLLKGEDERQKQKLHNFLCQKLQLFLKVN
jgi:hypothetical protein